MVAARGGRAERRGRATHCIRPEGFASRRYAGAALCEQSRELRPRADAELPEDVPEMLLDCLRTEVELLCDLAVRQPLRDRQGDLELLRGQPALLQDLLQVDPLPGSTELCRCTLRPRPGPERLEHVERFVEWVAGLAQTA